jgi:hypothetical protein
MNRISQFALAFVFVVSYQMISARFAAAQFVVDFDENGHGTVNGATMAFTTGPLRYQFPGGGLTPGDVVVTETPVGTNQTDSDILQFDANGGISVFSDLEAGETPPFDLADVPATAFPIPPSGSPIFPETDPSGGPAIEGGINGLFNYAPVPGMPGSLPTGGQIIYNFTSDVPEPGSICLLAVGASALMLRRRVVA